MFNSVSLTLYFNSRPHGGRHSHGAGIGSSFCISTHALTEGDVDKVPIIPTPSISTHALTEGDGSSTYIAGQTRDFNSRPHGGRQAQWTGDAEGRHFNSRPHGGRLKAVALVDLDTTFQLTPSRRATGPFLQQRQQ